MPLPVVLLLSAVLAVLGLVPPASHAQQRPVRSAARAVEAVDAFRTALVRGDSAAVAEMLLPEAVVLESGGMETKREYLGHHFHADHAFLSGMSTALQKQEVRVEGAAAWVSSTRNVEGTYRGDALEMASAEVIVLRRLAPGDAWKISAIHWSSRARE